MGDFLGVALPICGLGIICLGVVAVGAFLFLRSTGLNFGSIIDVVTGGGSSDNDDDDEVLVPRRKKTNLRARADALDFDASVQKYTSSASSASGKPNLAARYKATGLDAAPPPPNQPLAPLGGASSSPRLGNFERDNSSDEQSLRRGLRRRDRSDDEVFGGMLDDEGDGIIDY